MAELSEGDCRVCISGYDGDDCLDYETYYERNIAIKRNCCCYECGVIIKAGTIHQQCGGTYEGERKNWRFCLICAEISKAFSCDGGRLFGVLWEQVEENVFPNMTTGCLAKLKTAAAKQHLVNKWNEWKFGRKSV